MVEGPSRRDITTLSIALGSTAICGSLLEKAQAQDLKSQHTACHSSRKRRDTFHRRCGNIRGV